MSLLEDPEIRAAEQATAEAFADPRVGDSFQEMLTFRAFVIAVEPHGRVAVMTATPPCTLPDDGDVKIFPSHDAYRAAFAYKSIPGYWVRLDKRGVGVRGWFPGWPEPEPEPEPARVVALAGVLARAEEIITEHQRLDSISCRCGYDRWGASHSAHVADKLAEAGLLGEEAQP